jgi:hypothetical protein
VNHLLKNTLLGWSNGYHYIQVNFQEETIKAGGSYILASFYLEVQLLCLSRIINKLAIIIFPSKNAPGFVKIASFTFPFVLLAGIVTEGKYPALVEKWNSIFPFPQLSPNLSNKYVVTPSNFLSKHSSKILNVAALITSTALIALGNPYYGATALVAISYHIMAKRGWVPYKVSLFMERYMPILTEVTELLLETNSFNQVIAGISLIPRLFHNQVFLSTIDLIFHRIFKREGFTFKEMFAPQRIQQDLSYEEMIGILYTDPRDFQIDPAHCSKFAIEGFSFEKDDDFTKFSTLFNSITWKQKYLYIVSKLKNDENFISFLNEKKNQGSLANSTKDKELEEYIEELAQQDNISKEDYVAKWVQEQMTLFVQGLKRERIVPGGTNSLEVAIKTYGHILPYLEKLNSEKSDPIFLEDILLKIAVEGGSYCTIKLKQTASEIEKSILSLEKKKFENPASKEDIDPIKSYELKLKVALEEKRLKLIQNNYLKSNKIFLDSLKNELHIFDEQKIPTHLGFYPLYDYEKANISIMEFLAWEAWYELRQQMYKFYLEGLEETIQSLGNQHFSDYLVQFINENPKLSQDQKNSIINDFWNGKGAQCSKESTQKRFHYLVLVMLGVLRSPLSTSQEETKIGLTQT